MTVGELIKALSEYQDRTVLIRDNNGNLADLEHDDITINSDGELILSVNYHRW